MATATNDENIAFIGGGNMTRAIVSGLLDGGYDATRLAIAEPQPTQQDTLLRNFAGVVVRAENDAIAASADVVVLAVKPQILATVCRALADVAIESRPLIVSIAAGVRSEDIDRWLGGGHAIVRVMPNQPALLRAGISGVYANAATSDEQLHAASRIMSAVGHVVEVPSESDIDAVTAISGSGPAYFYLLIDMLTQTGHDLGLDADTASRLAIGTAQGAAALAAGADESMTSLISKVRSPGGTTAAALDSLLQQDVRDIFARALTAARDRARALADEAHTDQSTQSSQD